MDVSDVLSIFKNSFARHPLAMLALAAMVGILVADQRFSAPIACVAFVLLVFVVWRPSTWPLLVATALAFGFIHWCGLRTSRDHPLRELLGPTQRVSAVLHGTFVRARMIPDQEQGRQMAIFQVNEIWLPARQQRIIGETKVRVWLADATFVPHGGDYQLEGTLSLVQRPWNASLFDPVQTALRQGIIADLFPTNLEAVGAPRFSLRLVLLRYAELCRHWVERQLALGIEDQEMPRTLVTTMALGTAETDTADLEEPFRNSGTLHVFAVSGLHVGLLAAIGWMFLRGTPLGRTRSVLVLLPFLFGYAFVTGWVPSAARAAFMAAIMLVAPLLNRKARLLNSLGAAALILLAVDTQQLFQPGFQLSFGVLAAIAIGARWFEAPLKPWAELDPFLPRSLANLWQRGALACRRMLVSLLATSSVAWLGSVPLVMHHFQACTPISVLANCVLVPLSSVSLFTVVLSLMSAVAGLSWLQSCLNNANWLLAVAMMNAATAFSAVPGSHFPISVSSFLPGPEATLSVLSMPPGEGAQVLRSAGQTWLLDCGSSKHYRRNLLPFLRYKNTSRIQGVILSHADADHGGAAKDLVHAWGQPAVWCGPHEPWRLDSRQTTLWQVQAELSKQGRSLQRLLQGDVLPVGEAKITVLYPSPDDVHDKADDRALVLLIEHSGFRILSCNDAGFISEKALLERYAAEQLRSDVLIRNQHATDWSVLPEFMLSVNPRAIISSNAPLIAEQRLPKRLVEYCQQKSIRLFDQNETGMVEIEIRRGGLSLDPWLAGETLLIRH